MKRLLSVLVPFLLVAIPAEVFAKADTSKIAIKGADLEAPIEITDLKTLAKFSVWTGPGTSCTGSGCPGTSAKQTESFMSTGPRLWQRPQWTPTLRSVVLRENAE